MTDNEIIKALECCRDCKCKDCPCHNKETDGCKELDEQDILDLINRQKATIERQIKAIQEGYALIEKQKAEIERLKEERIERIRELTRTVYDKEIAEAKAEAIKEFAEKLKDLLNFYDPKCKFVHIHIDNLVKEMTEQRKEEEGK